MEKAITALLPLDLISFERPTNREELLQVLIGILIGQSMKLTRLLDQRDNRYLDFKGVYSYRQLNNTLMYTIQYMSNKLPQNAARRVPRVCHSLLL